ncbi:MULTISPECIES: hypothetical protein [unclassified Neisseria]|uniref:hypothetical protein n=1 Tax=unclassified Neisseria TaxID=2623750 RepID=UPI0026665F3D|nr:MULTISPECIES: hypothetical protein [unclassified Neisseria]MDO1509411.1 hypothetical protein [Neisseria sp. MVDL19-042950]MDO1515816.1 hypothetical protein [Neisseria sp. MVDL18-041461]MDO1563360.1 hypothetical protein [Neisseria sp. MVDL20-010259]
MKKVLIAAAFAGLMLSACSSSKTEKAPEANLTVEQAMQECQQVVGTQDRAAFDACMKDKGFERPAADAGAAAPAAPAAPAPTK